MMKSSVRSGQCCREVRDERVVHSMTRHPPLQNGHTLLARPPRRVHGDLGRRSDQGPCRRAAKSSARRIASKLCTVAYASMRQAFGLALVALIGIGGGQARASAGCDAVNAGEFNQTVTGGSGGATIGNFAIGDIVDFVVNSAGGGWDLITGNDTVLASFGTGRFILPHTVTGAHADTTLQSVAGSAGLPISVTATCTPAAASRD